MSALTTVAGSQDLNEQERQLIAAARAMTASARGTLIRMAESIAHGLPAARPRLTLAHSGPGRAHQ